MTKKAPSDRDIFLISVGLSFMAAYFYAAIFRNLMISFLISNRIYSGIRYILLMIPFVGIAVWIITLIQIRNKSVNENSDLEKNLKDFEFANRNLSLLVIILMLLIIKAFISSNLVEAAISGILTAMAAYWYYQNKSAHLWMYMIAGLAVIALPFYINYLKDIKSYLFIPYGLVSLLAVFHLDRFRFQLPEETPIPDGQRI